MCMFSFVNTTSVKARIKGLERFECGSCPECLQKKSRIWALRTSMEARVNLGMMITLTYDTYKNINTLEENPVDTSLTVCKKHCQDFIKRLRYHYQDKKIKYIITAEYGKRTHRAHYHALIFGIQFNDLIPLKFSSRGNQIYRSKTLTEIWGKGICTVDSINLTAKTARYCTKYCAKDSGSDNTFMLFSRGIGEEELLKRFNGKSYYVEGREYPIPKTIWKKKVEEFNNIQGYSKYKNIMNVQQAQKLMYNSMARHISNEESQEELELKIFRAWNHAQANFVKSQKSRKVTTRLKYHQLYLKFSEQVEKFKKDLKNLLEKDKKFEKNVDIITKRFENSAIAYHRSKIKREILEKCRDNNTLYKAYCEYWKKKASVYKLTQKDDYTRILYLPDDKYRSYKNKALLCKRLQIEKKSFLPPRTNIQAFLQVKIPRIFPAKSFAPFTSHNWANDRTPSPVREKLQRFKQLCRQFMRLCNDMDRQKLGEKTIYYKL